MRRSALIAAVIALVAAAPAHGAAYVPRPPAGYAITSDAPPGMTAWAYADVQTNVIHAPHGLTGFARVHEVGHLFDWQVLSASDREMFRRITHAPRGDWWTFRPVVGDGAEYFADYYAAAAVGFDPRHGNPGSYGPITYARLSRFELALFGIAVRDGLYGRGTLSHRGV